MAKDFSIVGMKATEFSRVENGEDWRSFPPNMHRGPLSSNLSTRQDSNQTDDGRGFIGGSASLKWRGHAIGLVTFLSTLPNIHGHLDLDVEGLPVDRIQATDYEERTQSNGRSNISNRVMESQRSPRGASNVGSKLSLSEDGTYSFSDVPNQELPAASGNLHVKVARGGGQNECPTVALLDSGATGYQPNCVSKQFLQKDLGILEFAKDTTDVRVLGGSFRTSGKINLKFWPLLVNRGTGRLEQGIAWRMDFHVIDDYETESRFGDLLLGQNFIDRINARVSSIHQATFTLATREPTEEERRALEQERIRRDEVRELAAKGEDVRQDGHSKSATAREQSPPRATSPTPSNPAPTGRTTTRVKNKLRRISTRLLSSIRK
ncbi:hypothetical protein K449DRAFT_420570 [Hypoxylon sp. EC38]|nr:hypothetical protein K449DRAFT_420570 [Hypoxylon sp. EC38]